MLVYEAFMPESKIFPLILCPKIKLVQCEWLIKIIWVNLTQRLQGWGGRPFHLVAFIAEQMTFCFLILNYAIRGGGLYKIKKLST